MGFSIVEQDMISKMVSAKPEHLRNLIDQVAGTTQYKHKKKLAHNKLKSTQQNIFRLEDVVLEQQKQLKRLEKQVRQAQLYKKLKNQINDIEVYLLKKQYTEVLDQIEKKQHQIQTLLKHIQQSKQSFKSITGSI